MNRKTVTRVIAPLLVLVLYAIAGVVNLGTWLLNRWNRRQVTKRAAQRRERARVRAANIARVDQEIKESMAHWYNTPERMRRLEIEKEQN